MESISIRQRLAIEAKMLLGLCLIIGQIFGNTWLSTTAGQQADNTKPEDWNPIYLLGQFTSGDIKNAVQVEIGPTFYRVHIQNAAPPRKRGSPKDYKVRLLLEDGQVLEPSETDSSGLLLSGIERYFMFYRFVKGEKSLKQVSVEHSGKTYRFDAANSREWPKRLK